MFTPPRSSSIQLVTVACVGGYSNATRANANFHPTPYITGGCSGEKIGKLLGM